MKIVSKVRKTMKSSVSVKLYFSKAISLKVEDLQSGLGKKSHRKKSLTLEVQPSNLKSNN